MLFMGFFFSFGVENAGGSDFDMYVNGGLAKDVCGLEPVVKILIDRS
jgi:hypothetical protein